MDSDSKRDEGGAVVPVAKHQVLPAKMKPTVGTSLWDCPTNLDLTTREGRALVLAAGNPGDYEFEKDGSVFIVATNYLILPEEREDPETGELHTFCRTILFDAEGRTFRTTAAHAPERMRAALDLFGPSDWKEGIPFRIRQRLGKQGRVYHDIRLDEFAAE